MKLKKIALHSLPGFKFRGIEIQSLHPGLNVIVGPNGSGKTSICQAACKLLWPEKAQHLSPGFIHSEWQHRGESFTISIEDGCQKISQNGKKHCIDLPEASLATCFNVTIDDLFDSKDQPFAQKISLAIAGGCDVKTAQERITPLPAAKSAVLDWKKAKNELEQYREAQERLRQESNELPALEQSIEEAEAANAKSQMLQKIIEAKKIKQKILVNEASLAAFPKQLLLSKIEANDWKSYQQLVKKQAELREEIAQIKTEIASLETSLGKWDGVALGEGELDQQQDRIARLQQYQVEKDRMRSHIAALEVSVNEECRLLGITSDDDIENIKAVHLDQLDTSWKVQEQLQSEIAGIEEQIRLNSTEMELSSAKHEQEVSLLTELSAIPQNSVVGLWIMTLVSVAIAGGLFFSLHSNMARLLILGLFTPLGYLWMAAFRNARLRQECNQRYKAMGLAPLNESTPSEILQRLQLAVKALGDAQYRKSQIQRKNDLLQRVEHKLNEQKKWKVIIFEKAQEAGINKLPECRYRFSDFLKQLHLHWIKLKIARSDLQQVIDRFDAEWGQWQAFAVGYGEENVSNVYELAKIWSRIKQRTENAQELNRKKMSLVKKEETLSSNIDDLQQLLIRANCEHNPSHLKALVEQLPEYHQTQHQIKLLKAQFDELSFELGNLLTERVHDELTDLESEKREQESKAKTLQQLSEKKGTLKARIDLMAGASHGQKLINQHNHAFEAVQNAARDFSRKGLMEYLVAEVEKDFQRDCQPKVLQNAAHWFQKFTKSKYVLQMPTSDTGTEVYEAIETSTSERKSLNQLSRGTRMQLLMAVRLSIAFESEDESNNLPIFLDEVLSNTDSERFDAIAEIIGDLIDSGRQVFYFTCNSEDAWRWRKRCPEAHLIDLAAIRAEQAFLAAPLAIPKSEMAIQPPENSNMAVSEYAAKLKLPACHIDQPIEMVSVHYLVDSSEDLYRLLTSGVTTYGNLKHLRKELVENSFPAGIIVMNRRSELLEMVFQLKTQGRGGAITKQVLIQAGVSDTFQDRLWNLAQELNGDARQLVAVIKSKKDERTKGFLIKMLEQLNEYLLQKGYIDERPVLSDDEIRHEFMPKISTEADRLFLEMLLDQTSIC